MTPVERRLEDDVMSVVDKAFREVDDSTSPAALCFHSSGQENCFGCGAGTVYRCIRFRLDELFGGKR